MKTRLAVAVLLLAAVPLLAHHSYRAEYDLNQPVTITGVVAKVEWMNPHGKYFIDATNENGQVIHCEVETVSPNVLLRRGWTRNSIAMEARVTVSAYRAKKESNLAFAGRFTLADGEFVNMEGPDFPDPFDLPQKQ